MKIFENIKNSQIGLNQSCLVQIILLQTDHLIRIFNRKIIADSGKNVELT